MKTTIPTKDHAIKILDLLSHGLVGGLGRPIKGQMCVEACVCYAMGLPHSDDPGCVYQIIRSLKIAVNDNPNWSSNMARADGLRRLAIAQLGSLEIDPTIFVKELVLGLIQKVIPISLRLINLEKEALACEQSSNLEEGKNAADAAARAAITDARVACAARAAARTAARVATDVVDAATYATYVTRVAADAAARAARAARAAITDAAYAADAAARAARAARAADKILRTFAECAVQALIKCKSQGSEWLDLCPLQ